MHTGRYKAANSDNPDLRPTAPMINATMDAHAKCSDGSAVTALKILRDMRQHVRLDTISYNTVINCFAKCRDGSATAAMGVFTEMRQNGIFPNTVTYHSLVDAQARQKDGSAQDTVRILEEMMRPGNPGSAPPDLSIFTTAINMQAKCRDGSGVSALQLLSLMKQNGVAPTAVTLNSVIDAQAKQKDGKARVALTILDAMRQSRVSEVRPTVVTYTSVIDAQAKCPDGEGRTAVALMEEMVTEGLKPNHMTYGCCINAQAKRGNAKVASLLLEKMLASGLEPSHAQYNAVLDAHARCQDGSAQEALLVLDGMRRRGTEPNVISYSACIDAQAKREDGSAETAVQLLEELLERRIRPEMVTFAAAIEAQAKRKDGSPEHAAVILDGMGAYIKPNQVHYNSVLNACANKRPAAAALAENVFGKMCDKGIYPNIYTVSALLRAAGFSEPPRPDLARLWFSKYCTSSDGRSAQVETNDHIVRALRISLSDDEAAQLLQHAPGAPAMRRSTRDFGGPRDHHAGGHDPASPTVRRISRVSQSPSAFGGLLVDPPVRRIQRASSDVACDEAQQPRRIQRASQQSNNWRDSGSNADGPSSKLFTAPTTGGAGTPKSATFPDSGFGSNDWRSSPAPASPRQGTPDLLSADAAFGQTPPVRRGSRQMDPETMWRGGQQLTSPTPSRGHSPTPSPRGLSPTVTRRLSTQGISGVDAFARGVPSDRPVSSAGRRGSAIARQSSGGTDMPPGLSAGLSPMSISLAAAKLPPPGLPAGGPGSRGSPLFGSSSLPSSPRTGHPPGASPTSFTTAATRLNRPSPLPPPGLSPGPSTPNWSQPGTPNMSISEPEGGGTVADMLLLSEKMLNLQSDSAGSPLSGEHDWLANAPSSLEQLAKSTLGSPRTGSPGPGPGPDTSSLQALLSADKIPRMDSATSNLAMLLSPDAFLTQPSPKRQTPTKTPTSNSVFVREPEGPDGSRGFGGRRVSSAACPVPPQAHAADMDDGGAEVKMLASPPGLALASTPPGLPAVAPGSGLPTTNGEHSNICFARWHRAPFP